jgi:hypothetical protein
LYHLPEPWKLIEQLPAVAPILFIWTQYAAEEEAVDIGRGLRGKIHVEGGPEEPLSGMSATSIWLTLASLRELLSASGYKKIDIIHDDPAHANGPAVTIGATTG